MPIPGAGGRQPCFLRVHNERKVVYNVRKDNGGGLGARRGSFVRFNILIIIILINFSVYNRAAKSIMWHSQVLNNGFNSWLKPPRSARNPMFIAFIVCSSRNNSI